MTSYTKKKKKEFVILKPNLNDFLERIAERGPQIVMPKDASLILAKTGISSQAFVVDGGTGSAFLSIFLANYVSSGKVVTYETDERWFKVAQKNIKNSGLKNILLKKRDITKGISEKEVDLVTLDLQDSYAAVPRAYKALKIGGWLAIYSPHVEQVVQVTKEIKKKGFSIPKTFESIVREWKVERTTHPRTMGLMHTGFLTFARKVR